MIWPTNKVHRAVASARGAAAVEVALVLALFLVPFLLLLWDVGLVALGKAELDEALQDTMTYVSAGNASNSSGITAAAQKAYGTSITVSTSTVCYCVATGTSQPTAPSSIACTSTCNSGYVRQQFMNITVSTEVDIPFPVSGFNLTSPLTLTTTGSVRTG